MKLSDYYTGHLDDDERRVVESHLAVCPSCTQAINMITLLATDPGPDWTADAIGHPTAELLSTFYNDPRDLDGNTRNYVEGHLDSCHRCRSDLEFMTHMEQELRDTIGATDSSTRPELSFVEFIKGVLRRPLPGFAGVVAMVVIVLGVVWINRFYHQSPPFEFPGGETVYRLSETLRSAGEPPVIVRPVGDSAVFLEIPFYTRSDARYLFHIVKGDDAGTMVQPLVPDMRERGIVRLRLDPHALNDGTFYTRMSEIRTTRLHDTLRILYPFIVRGRTAP